MEKYGTASQVTDNNIIRNTRTTWWVKATDTRSEYVILNAFPPQQWLRERAYTYEGASNENLKNLNIFYLVIY